MQFQATAYPQVAHRQLSDFEFLDAAIALPFHTRVFPLSL
jgi:hypothetical protein